MRKIGSIIAGLLGVILVLLLLELFVPAAHGITFGFLKLFGTIFYQLHLSDTVISIILFIVLAIGLFGSVYGLSRKRENKIWGIVSVIVSIISIVGIIFQHTHQP